MTISVILLAGGLGKRMENSCPKQFLPLHNKPVALHSFEQFNQLDIVAEIIVVCAEEYRHLFSHLTCRFAQPGPERQDSVWNGLKQCSSPTIAVHDSARPFVDKPLLDTLFAEAQKHPAVISAVPVKATIKAVSTQGYVTKTLDRSTLWEIHTPQVFRRELLEAGLIAAQKRGLTVSDDAAAVELLGQEIRIVQGSYHNIKITTPEDLIIAECFVIN